jgi:hypothetical protein
VLDETGGRAGGAAERCAFRLSFLLLPGELFLLTNKESIYQGNFFSSSNLPWLALLAVEEGDDRIFVCLSVLRGYKWVVVEFIGRTRLLYCP